MHLELAVDPSERVPHALFFDVQRLSDPLVLPSLRHTAKHRPLSCREFSRGGWCQTDRVPTGCTFDGTSDPAIEADSDDESDDGQPPEVLPVLGARIFRQHDGDRRAWERRAMVERKTAWKIDEQMDARRRVVAEAILLQLPGEYACKAGNTALYAKGVFTWNIPSGQLAVVGLRVHGQTPARSRFGTAVTRTRFLMD